MKKKMSIIVSIHDNKNVCENWIPMMNFYNRDWFFEIQTFWWHFFPIQIEPNVRMFGTLEPKRKLIFLMVFHLF